MEKQKLNPDQIQTLFEFIEQKGVKYYDLQLELVDHFASAIEARWEKDPERDFTILIKEIYRDFKDYEFKRLIRQKMRALNRKSWRMAWSFFRSFLTWPKVVLTFLAVFTCHEVLVHSQLGVGIFKWYALVLFILCAIVGIQMFRSRPRGKKFLVFTQTGLLLLSWFNLVVVLFVQLPQWLNMENDAMSGWQLWLASGLMVFVLLILIGFFFFSRMEMHRELEKAFPKYVR